MQLQKQRKCEAFQVQHSYHTARIAVELTSRLAGHRVGRHLTTSLDVSQHRQLSQP